LKLWDEPRQRMVSFAEADIVNRLRRGELGLAKISSGVRCAA
jgi:hypothetical protein